MKIFGSNVFLEGLIVFDLNYTLKEKGKRNNELGTGIVAVLPGKFLKSLQNRTSLQARGVFGVLVVRYDIRNL